MSTCAILVGIAILGWLMWNFYKMASNMPEVEDPFGTVNRINQEVEETS